MDPNDHRQDDLDARRSRARRTALVIAAIAILIYVGFIVVNGGLLK